MNTPELDIGVYLDTNVLIDFAEGLDPEWSPPPVPTKSEAQKIAAVRVFFYGYRTRNGWWLVVSGEGRKELTARGAPDWTLSVFFDIDQSSDAPTTEEVAALAHRYAEQVGFSEPDARHLARVVLHDWIRYFVTNDSALNKQWKRLDLPDRLSVITAIEAEELLKITPGEQPPITPASSSPLAHVHPWWIPIAQGLRH